MLKIKIIAMGKLTEKAYRDASAEFVKRLSRTYPVTFAEPKVENLPANPIDKQGSSFCQFSSQLNCKHLAHGRHSEVSFHDMWEEVWRRSEGSVTPHTFTHVPIMRFLRVCF